jgi:hypothetical protein
VQHTTTPASRDFEVVVPGTPAQVRERLTRELHGVRSLWAPTLRELRAWDASTAALYVRWIGERGFEVGPRLVNPQAARMSPVLRGRLEEAGTGQTRISGSVRMPAFVVGLFLVWGVVLLVWLALLLVSIRDGVRQPGVLMVWLVPALGTVIGIAVGWVAGGSALRQALPELGRVGSDPASGEDDWA